MWCNTYLIASVPTVSPVTRIRVVRWYLVRKTLRKLARTFFTRHCLILPFYVVLAYEQELEPEPSPCANFECGTNAICRERDGIAICQCTSNYAGNPYLACRPECVINPDCPSNLMCVRNKCVNPCAGVCGQNAECSVVNHQPMCTCLPGYSGDPFVSCFVDSKCHQSHTALILFNNKFLNTFFCDIIYCNSFISSYKFCI